MDISIFSSQFQSVINQLILKLLEGYSSPGSSSASAEPGRFYTTVGSSPGQFEALIQQAAARYNVDPRLVKSVIRAESGFDSSAVSPAGAQGLMQLMPATAAGLGVTNPFDPQQNIDGGVRLLRRLLNRYDNNLQLALAAYNAGPGAVARYGGIPPYRETQIYVKRVMGLLQSEYSWSV